MMWLLYHLMAIIDTIVYGLAAAMFRIIYDIASTEFFKANQIEAVANRVYVIVGVLMLFKIVISAIQYLINPDSFDDKEKGVAGLLRKTVISLGLMVVAPVIFNFLVEIQGPILKSLPSIVLGSEATDHVDDKSLGFDLSFTVLKSFVRLRKDIDGKGDEITDLWQLNVHVTDGCPAFSLFGLVSTDNCKYDYMIIISTLCGGFLCYVLLSMILDIAIRTIKFGVIRILAPIPIASYIVSKDKLNKFIKMATTVYLDLFIRMIIVYFILFAIKSMFIENNLINVLNINGGGVADTGNWFRNVIVNIALIFGILMFAKSAPKFISELLGLPDVGSGEMADMFKPAWQRAGGAAGALVNPLRTAAANALTSYQQADNLRGTRAKKLRRALRAVGGGMRGLAEGSLDSVQGTMAGDDWAKMRQRRKDRDLNAFKRAYAAKYYRTQTKQEARKQKWENRKAGALSFIGQTPVDSAGYKEASSTLGTFRSEAFTGRAKGEVDKAPAMFRTISAATAGLTGGALQITNMRTGTARAIRTTFDVEDAGGKQYNNCDYEKLHNLFVKVQAGTATAADYSAVEYTDAAGNLQHFTAADASIVSDVHERVGKKAYSEYVDIAIAAKHRLDTDPNLTATEKTYLESLCDKEVLERVERYREAIGALNIKADEKKQLFDALEEDAGKFLAGANKIVQTFSTEAARREKMEQAAGGGNSGKK